MNYDIFNEEYYLKRYRFIYFSLIGQIIAGKINMT